LEFAVEESRTHADREESEHACEPVHFAHGDQRIEDKRNDSVVNEIKTKGPIPPLGQGPLLARIAVERDARNPGDEAKRGNADAQELPLGLGEELAAYRKSRNER